MKTEQEKIEGMLKEDSCKGIQKYYLTAYYNSLKLEETKQNGFIAAAIAIDVGQKVINTITKPLKDKEKVTNCDTVFKSSTRKIKNNCRIICKRRHFKRAKK